MKIGVLALQGAFHEHIAVLTALGAATSEVRVPGDLTGCNGLILPGGETTTQRKLAVDYGLWQALRERCTKGAPVLATCAGLILLSKRIDGKEGLSLDCLDVDVHRNAYGRQVASFEAPLPFPCLHSDNGFETPFPALFIRAPRITRTGPDVEILASFDNEPVAVRQGNILGLTFHPELTPDDRVHRYFLERVVGERSG